MERGFMFVHPNLAGVGVPCRLFVAQAFAGIGMVEKSPAGGWRWEKRIHNLSWVPFDHE
jgi:hypothetical protein